MPTDIKKPPFMKAAAGGVLAAAILTIGSAAGAQTLEQALSAAYANNPELLAARAELRAVDERVPRALADWRPDVTLSSDISRQHTDFNNRRGEQAKTRTPRGATLSVTQPLFRGFRTEAGIRVAESDVQAERAQLIATEQDTLLDVVTAFMAVVRDQAVLDLNIGNEQVLRRQLEATQDRFRVGEITRTDVSQAEARLAGATADRIQAEGNLEISRASYVNVVGEAPGKLTRPPALSGLPASLDESADVALKNHPDIVAARFGEISARENVRRVTGELLPSLNLTGTARRRFEVSEDDNRQDTGQIQLNLSVPLYQGGGVYSRLREAKQDAGQSRLDLEDARRDITESLRDAWETLATAQARIQAFQSQIQANEVALEGVQREAQVGSRTVLDVLDAEQELLDSRVSLVRAQRDEVVASYSLLEAIGSLTAADLKLPVDIYDPLKHYNEVRDKRFGGRSTGGADVEFFPKEGAK